VNPTKINTSKQGSVVLETAVLLCLYPCKHFSTTPTLHRRHFKLYIVIDEHIFYYPDFLLIFFLNSFSMHSLHTPLQLLSHLVTCSASWNHFDVWCGKGTWLTVLKMPVFCCHGWAALFWDLYVQLNQLDFLTLNLVQGCLVIYSSTTEGGGRRLSFFGNHYLHKHLNSN